MAKDVKAPRPYHSPRRQQQALATRKSVIAAATRLFLEVGYVAASIDAIAAAANVSPETIYSTFKNKRMLLSETVDVAIAGDHAPIPILERPWVDEMRHEPELRSRVDILARNGSLILERWVPIYNVLRGAAAADPHAAEILERTKAQRYEGQRVLLSIARGDHRLRKGLTESAAADILFTIGNPETFRSLVTDRGWSRDRFARWYADALMALLFEV